MNETLALLKALEGERSIAYKPAYRKITGSTTAAILLSQLVYWALKMNGDEFYKTDAELLEETGLGTKEYKNAKQLLQDKLFVFVKVKGVPAKSYYTVDLQTVCAYLIRLAETDKLDMPKGTNKPGRKGQTIYTKEYTREGEPAPQKLEASEELKLRATLYEVIVKNHSSLLPFPQKITEILDFVLSVPGIDHLDFVTWVCLNKDKIANAYSWKAYYLGDYIDRNRKTNQQPKLAAEIEVPEINESKALLQKLYE